MDKIWLGKYYDEYQSLLSELDEYIDKNYLEDYEFKDGEIREIYLEFFKKNGSKELYEFLKNRKLIDNPPDMIID